MMLVNVETPEEILMKKEAFGNIIKALEKIPPREERVLRMRFGMHTDEHILKDIGVSFNVSGERIRHIEGKALRRLKRSKLIRESLAILIGNEDYNPNNCGKPTFIERTSVDIELRGTILETTNRNYYIYFDTVDKFVWVPREFASISYSKPGFITIRKGQAEFLGVLSS